MISMKWGAEPPDFWTMNFTILIKGIKSKQNECNIGRNAYVLSKY